MVSNNTSKSFDKFAIALSYSCLHAAGAMRLPGDVNTSRTKIHFLTNFYIEQMGLQRVKFKNYDENGLLCFYGKKPIRMAGKHTLTKS